MKIDLSGKQALVTGSTAGIGLAIATGLAQAGTGVIVNTILPGPTRTKGALQMMAGIGRAGGNPVFEREPSLHAAPALLHSGRGGQSERVCGVAPG